MAASSPLIEGKKISELRVADLRLELEQRGIDTKGLKADLVRKLEKSLLEESVNTPEAVTPTNDSEEGTKKAAGRKGATRTKMPITQENEDAKDEDGSTEEVSTDVPHSFEHAGENQETLSESLIVNTNDSVAYEADNGDLNEESRGSCENPDNFFQEGIYGEEGVGNIEEDLDQEAQYRDEGGIDETYEVVGGEEQYDDAGEEFEAEEEYEEPEEEFDKEEMGADDQLMMNEAEQQQEGEVLDGVEGDAEVSHEDSQQNVDVVDAEMGSLNEEGRTEDQEYVEDVADEEEVEEVEDDDFEQGGAEEYPEEEDTEEGKEEDFGNDETGVGIILEEGDVENGKEEEEEDCVMETQTPPEELAEDQDKSLEETNNVDSKGTESFENEAVEGVKSEDEVLSSKEVGEGDNVDQKDDIDVEVTKDDDSVKRDENEDTSSSQDKSTDATTKESDQSIVPDSLTDNTKMEEISKDPESNVAAESKQESKDGKGQEAPAKGPSQTEKDAKKEIIKSLWISGLSSVTRAVDLKTAFSAHGKVIGAKVVTSARSPGTHCFGFVTMSSFEEATKCIEKLNKTEIHGKIVTVERAKHDPTPKKPPPKQDKKPEDKKQPPKPVKVSKQGSTSDKAETYIDSKGEKDKKGDEKIKSDLSRSRSDRRGQDRPRRSGSHSRHRPSSRENQRSRSPGSSKSKESRRADESKEKGRSSESSSEKKVKSLNELKEEREQKIEKERKQREERRRKEREKERQLREERRKAQEERERERRERARKEDERMRRERERQRELEKERELRKKRERERLAQERKEKEREREERDRLEKERREREARLERERLEKERQKREREEKERIERERLERERLERERIAYDRLRKEREELEKIKTERERLEKERLEFERRYALKRSSSSSGRRETTGERTDDSYHPEPKRHALESSRGGHGGRPSDFFGGTHSTRDGRVTDSGVQRKDDSRGRPDSIGHTDYSSKRDGSRHSSHDTGYHGGSISKSGRESSPFSYNTSRARDRSPISAHTGDVRREELSRRDERRDDILSRNPRRVVSSRDERERSPRKSGSDILRDVDQGRVPERSSSRSDRASHRDGDGLKYYDADEKPRADEWLENQELRNPPKTLTEILARAGVSGILGGSAFDQQVTMTVNDALSIAAASRLPKQDLPDWRGDRRDQRREDRIDDRLEVRRDERHVDRRDDRHVDRRDDRRDDRERPSTTSRDSRTGREFYGRESERSTPSYSQSDDITRRQGVDLTVSRRAQELLAQAGLQDTRGRPPPTQSAHSREIPLREVSRELPVQRGYQQRASELETYSRGIARSDMATRQDVSNRNYQPPTVISQQLISAGQPHIASRPSSQDNWNRSRNIIPAVNAGAGFPVPISGAIIGSSHVRGQMHGRDMGRPGLQGHGLPHQIRRF